MHSRNQARTHTHLIFWFLKRLFSILCHNEFPLPSISQRAWLLKILAIELHTGDMTVSTHREACQNILAHLFGQNITEYGTDINSSYSMLENITETAGTRTISKITVHTQDSWLV